MYLLFIWGGTYGFGWWKIHNGGRLKGWALKSRLFWALKWQRAKRVSFGLKKVECQASLHIVGFELGKQGGGAGEEPNHTTAERTPGPP